MNDFNNIKINESMFDLYKIEIDMHSQKFIHQLESGLNEDSINTLISAISAIKGAAKLVKVEICS